MINTNRCFIHLKNGSIVMWTSEIEENYLYKEISMKVAQAVENGVISWEEVVRQINAQLPQDDIDAAIEKKMKMNVRATDLNLEKQVQDDNVQHGGDANPFTIQLPGDTTAEERDAAAKAAKEAALKKRAELKAAKERAAAEKAAAEKAAAEKAAAALDGAGSQGTQAPAPAEGECQQAPADEAGGENGGVNI